MLCERLWLFGQKPHSNVLTTYDNEKYLDAQQLIVYDTSNTKSCMLVVLCVCVLIWPSPDPKSRSHSDDHQPSSGALIKFCLPTWVNKHCDVSLQKLSFLLLLGFQEKTLETPKKSKKEKQCKAKWYARQKSADILKKLENQQTKQRKHLDTVCFINCLC